MNLSRIFIKLHVAIVSILLFFSTASKAQELYTSDLLKIKQLTPNTFVHISYLSTIEYGNVACNGMIVRDSTKALIFDTPANPEASLELIAWIQRELNLEIIAVIPTHFHEDCLAGLSVFHENGIPSYANETTRELARSTGETIPLNGFDNALEIPLENELIVGRFFGEGHTVDNIIGYFAKEQVVFGGCLVKSLGAGNGFLGDANTEEWSNTIQKLKTAYPDIKIVIPGHGKSGGIGLLDYTMELFR